MKVLISDKLSNTAVEIFKKAPGIEVHFEPGLGKDVAKLKLALADADAIAIRSGTNLTADVLAHAKKLKVIGRAGIGVDNVDINEASKRGIIVMNTPGGNTITTAEHAIAMMCALTRSIPQATASTKSGLWEKNKFMGSELTNKTLGIIGCGNIGKIVADRAQGLRMKVVVYDPFLTDELAQKLGVQKVELDRLYEVSDYITLHVPKNEKTSGMINAAAFKKMKRGVFLINCARGGIVNEADLAKAIEEHVVAGSALDVFASEPVDPKNPLLKLDQVICTPHLGAATEEAQENVAIDVASQIVDYLVHGTIRNALNFPSIPAEMVGRLKPYVILAEKIGKLHGQLAKTSVEEISIEYSGELSRLPTDSLTVAILKGILEPILEDVSVNLVNAPVVAKERGIKVRESRVSESENYTSLVAVTLSSGKNKRIISGTIFGKIHPRIVQVDNYYLEAVPEGRILVIHNEDRPGVVGSLGTLLAKNHINISRLQLGLDPRTKKAMAFYNIEGEVKESLLEEMRKIAGMVDIQQVVL